MMAFSHLLGRDLLLLSFDIAVELLFEKEMITSPNVLS